jgi:hypothetical protein
VTIKTKQTHSIAYREVLASRTTLFFVLDLMAPFFPLKWELAKNRAKVTYGRGKPLFRNVGQRRGCARTAALLIKVVQIEIRSKLTAYFVVVSENGGGERPREGGQNR